MAPDLLRQRICQQPARRIPARRIFHHAAVAAVLRPGEGAGDLDLLLIRRAEHPRDPWSGHMAFPGGRQDPDDADARATAERETREEVGLDLDRVATFLGPLSQLMARSGGRLLPMVISPFAYYVAAPPALHPSAEVAEALWIPLSFFRNPAHRETLSFRRGGLSLRLPCYRYEGRTVWGLTLGMIDELVERLFGSEA